MFVADCLQVNKQGHLCMEELDVLELAAKYGTPLYVMSETQIRKNCRMYQDSLKPVSYTHLGSTRIFTW